MQHYQPRTIALACELFHPPQPPDPRPVQKLHNAMFQTGQPAYSSFAVTPTGPILSNPAIRRGAVSQVAFLPDRFQFREEMGGMTAEAFGARVRHVAEKISPMHSIQVFMGQQVTLRSLINPRSFKNARLFLREGMFGFGDQEQTLGREPQLYGLRLVFQPEGDEKNTYALRIESYTNDPRSLFLEVQATFGPTMPGSDFSVFETRIIESYEFLTSRVLSFVARFDARQEA